MLVNAVSRLVTNHTTLTRHRFQYGYTRRYARFTDDFKTAMSPALLTCCTTAPVHREFADFNTRTSAPYFSPTMPSRSFDRRHLLP